MTDVRFRTTLPTEPRTEKEAIQEAGLLVAAAVLIAAKKSEGDAEAIVERLLQKIVEKRA